MKSVKMRIGPIGTVLLGVIAVTGLVTVAVCAPNALQLLKPFLKHKKYSHKQAVKRNIESLIRSGLVKMVVTKNGEEALELTSKGSWEFTIRNTSHKQKVWDRKWRIVIFDIPNTKTKLRSELTRGMRLYGFRLLQRSVWVYPYACDSFVKILREHLGIKEGVVYITASTIEGESILKKRFNL